MTADDSIASRLEELYVRHAPAAQRLACFLTGDPEAAQDPVQDTIVGIAGRFRHLRQPDAFDASLRRTIVNLHASRLRRLRSERLHPHDEHLGLRIALLRRARGATAPPRVRADRRIKSGAGRES